MNIGGGGCVGVIAHISNHTIDVIILINRAN